MKVRAQDGRVFDGTPIQIVQSMKSIALGAPNMTLGQYVDWVAARAEAIEGVALEVGGVTDEEKCARLIERMLERGLAERE